MYGNRQTEKLLKKKLQRLFSERMGNKFFYFFIEFDKKGRFHILVHGGIKFSQLNP